MQVTNEFDPNNQTYAEVVSFRKASTNSPRSKVQDTEYSAVEFRKRDTNINEESDSD